MGNDNGPTALALAPQHALTSREADGLVMHCSPAEALRRIQELQAFVKEVMTQGEDYGVIPGAGDKPALFQPGAQKLCEIYGLTPDFEDVEAVKDWEKGFFYFRKRCKLSLRRSGAFVGSGIGSCNSREDRYAWRWLWDNQIPAGIDKATLKAKSVGQKGAVKYRMPNDDIYSLVNTIEKMGAKRSLIHAVLGVTRSSGLFTQDVEDLPPEVFGHADKTRSWEQHKIHEGEIVEPEQESAEEKIARWTKVLAAVPNEMELEEVGKRIAKEPEAVKKALSGPYKGRKRELKETVPEERQPGSEG